MATLTFDRPAGFDLAKYDDDGRFGFGEGERVLLRFCIDRAAGAHLLETPLSRDQHVAEAPEGHYRICATVIDSGMLEWWLRGFGKAVWDIRREPIS